MLFHPISGFVSKIETQSEELQKAWMKIVKLKSLPFFKVALRQTLVLSSAQESQLSLKKWKKITIESNIQVSTWLSIISQWESDIDNYINLTSILTVTVGLLCVTAFDESPRWDPAPHHPACHRALSLWPHKVFVTHSPRKGFSCNFHTSPAQNLYSEVENQKANFAKIGAYFLVDRMMVEPAGSRRGRLTIQSIFSTFREGRWQLQWRWFCDFVSNFCPSPTPSTPPHSHPSFANANHYSRVGARCHSFIVF